jgi:hypothetical protein
MQEPRPGGSDDYTQTTELYLDVHVALEYLHCSYTDYIQQVPAMERTLYRLYLLFKNAREEHAQEQAQEQAEAQRDAPQMSPNMGRGRQ